MPNDNVICPPQPEQATCDAYPIAEHRLSQPQDDRVDVEHRLRAPVDIRRRFRDALDQPQHRARIVAPAFDHQQVVGARWLPRVTATPLSGAVRRIAPNVSDDPDRALANFRSP